MKFYKNMDIGDFKFQYKLSGFEDYIEFKFSLPSGNERQEFAITSTGNGRVELSNSVKIVGPRRVELDFQAEAVHYNGVVMSRFSTKFILYISAYDF